MASWTELPENQQDKLYLHLRNKDNWKGFTEVDILKARAFINYYQRTHGIVVATAWRELARPKQLPPDDPGHCVSDGKGYKCGCEGVDDKWNIFLIMCGRGFGKTWTGANWIVEQALSQKDGVFAVVAPTFRDVRATCFEGPSGILKQIDRDDIAPGKEFLRNELRLDLANGSRIYGFSADQPERLRGTNLSGAWCDEMGSWQRPETWYEALIPALRIGEHPRVVVTTTPRATPLVRDLLNRKDGTVHLTRASTWENAENLSAVALDELHRRYDGTRLGRQEIEGEFLDDLEGALWRRSDIDAARIRLEDLPKMTRVVVAVDPAVTYTEESDETGIVVAGEDGNGHGYILADLSLRDTPDACMRRAVNAFKRFEADCIVAEVNNGGDYLGTVLRAVDPNVPYRQVRASRGKAKRAEPAAALYEQQRIHHVGSFPELEDQLCNMTPGLDMGHDDRADACVYALYELRGLSTSSWLQAYGMRKCSNCGTSRQEMLPQCTSCGHEEEKIEHHIDRQRASEDDMSIASSWASVYQLTRCEKGHTYRDQGKSCPQCRGDALAFLKSQGNSVRMN